MKLKLLGMIGAVNANLVVDDEAGAIDFGDFSCAWFYQNVS